LKQYYINGKYYTEKDYNKILILARKYIYQLKTRLRNKVVSKLYNMKLNGLCRDVCNIIGEYVY
jgi:hypothetical protein